MGVGKTAFRFAGKSACLRGFGIKVFLSLDKDGTGNDTPLAFFNKLFFSVLRFCMMVMAAVFILSESLLLIAELLSVKILQIPAAAV